MTPAFMAHINGIVTSKNSVAVTERVKAMVAAGVEMKYRGFAEAPKAKARTFQENLVLINPLLPEVLAWILLGFYSERFPTRDVKTIVQELVAANPLQISRPEVRYEYMISGRRREGTHAVLPHHPPYGSVVGGYLWLH